MCAQRVNMNKHTAHTTQSLCGPDLMKINESTVGDVPYGDIKTRGFCILQHNKHKHIQGEYDYLHIRGSVFGNPNQRMSSTTKPPQKPTL